MARGATARRAAVIQAPPLKRLQAAHDGLLAVARELSASAAYWSEYDVPLGIVERLNAAIERATGETT